MKYFYGPVPSRRLGFSLGVDLTPQKTCSFDCVYCQVGKTPKTTLTRFWSVDLNQFKEELKSILKKNPRIDYITFSGSGEPTLHKDLGRIIRVIKKLTKNRYPVCVITNSSLLYRKSVRKELKAVDIIIPSLDAADSFTFVKINRPDSGLTFKRIVVGLVAFRKEFKGKFWLEVMLAKGINDSLVHAKKLKKIINRIKPDKVQLNLPVRPSVEKVKIPDKKRIEKIKEILSDDIPVEVASYPFRRIQKNVSKNIDQNILRYLKRRPASVKDLANSLGITKTRLNIILKKLIEKKEISKKKIQGKTFFVTYD